MPQTKPSTCSECSLVNIGKGFVPDIGAPVEYVFVGEAPGKNEVTQGKPFVGQAGFVLKNWGIWPVGDMRLAFEHKAIKFMNTLRCLPPEIQGRAYPRGKDKEIAEKCCRQYDDFGAAPCVVLFGESPQRCWFSQELANEDAIDKAADRDTKGVLGRVGRVYERDGRRWVFAPHPAAVLRQPALVEHLQKSIRIAVGETYFEPETVEWSRALGEAGDVVGLDNEWFEGKIGVLGLSWAGGTKCASAPRTDETFGQLLDALSKRKVIRGHNIIQGDFDQYRKEGVAVEELESKSFDTMLAFHATHGHLAGLGSYDLRSLVLILGRRQGKQFPLEFKQYEQDIYATCRMDAAACDWAGENLVRIIAAEHLEKTLAVSQRFAPIAARMTERGVKLDLSALRRIHQEREQRTKQTVEDFGLWEERGKKKIKRVPIWRSPKVLDKYEQLFGVRPKSNTKEEWSRLANSNRLPDDARQFAEAMLKLKRGANDAAWVGKTSVNEDGELDFGKVDERGFIHPRYLIHGTPDRPSTVNPPIMNWPRPKDDPRTTPIRSAVIPPEEGLVLFSADFSGIETYTQAIAANDFERVRAIQQGRLSHDNTAKFINEKFRLSLTRQQGKTINHAIDKGMSAWELSRHLFGDSSRKNVQLASQIQYELLTQYPVTMKFREDLYEACRSNPYIARDAFGRKLTVFGRGRYDDGGWSSEEAATRDRFKKALAFLGRAPAVTALLWVMIRIWEEKRLGEWSLPYFEVHDEGGWVFPQDKSEQYKKIILDTFEEPVVELQSIRLPAEGKYGRNWSEVH